MLQVEKKKPQRGSFRPWMGVVCLLMVAVVAFLLLRVNEKSMEEPEGVEHHDGIAYPHTEEEVSQVTVTLRSGETWTVLRSIEGFYTLESDPEYPLSDTVLSGIWEAACTVAWNDTLSDDPEEYAPHLSDFGLDTPRVTVTTHFTDGESVTLRIGNKAQGVDQACAYMLMEGDDRLFLVDEGTAETLNTGKAILRALPQPVLHAARMDAITLTTPAGITAAWTLSGAIDSGNAIDRWQVTKPVHYPADGESMATLTEMLSGLRMGAYVEEYTQDNKALYGFDQPLWTLEIHMAQGNMGQVDAEGQYTVTEEKEDTFRLTLGKGKNDLVDYVLWDGHVYLMSHYITSAIGQIDPAATASRYMVLTPLGNLSEMKIETSQGTDVYTVTRTEQVAPNNELVRDENGHIVTESTYWKNGVEVEGELFATAYARLLSQSVTGKLPAGYQAENPPHTQYTFRDKLGQTRTVALADFDGLHDAVLLDGQALFYLIKGGLTFSIS